MVIGKGLEQCLQRSNFDFQNDMLIQLGDIVDGWDDVYECFEVLNKIENKILIRGNHDDWLETFIRTGLQPVYWQSGGHSTFESYLKHNFSGLKPDRNYITNLDIPASHQKMITDQHNYYIDAKNRLFVHGGINRNLRIEDQYPTELYWNRSFWSEALSCKKDQKLNTIDNYLEVFIGHTATTNWSQSNRWIKNPKYGKPIDFPMESGEVWNLDTGSGWNGRLTIMDVETKQYWQSDPVKELYQNSRGRGG